MVQWAVGCWIGTIFSLHGTMEWKMNRKGKWNTKGEFWNDDTVLKMWIFYHLVKDKNKNELNDSVSGKLFFDSASVSIPFYILQKWNQISIWPQSLVLSESVLKGFVHLLQWSRYTYASYLLNNFQDHMTVKWKTS